MDFILENSADPDEMHSDEMHFVTFHHIKMHIFSFT